MSQQLVPIDGGVQKVQTTTFTNQLLVLSEQYTQANNLQDRPTEWNPIGRPIYRRLPAINGNYQTDFFEGIPAASTSGITEIQDIGYVYIPWNAGLSGPQSMEVVAADTKNCLLIKSGVIVWQYGTSTVLPTIVNLELLDVLSGKYDVAYQLVYDDSPIPQLYSVEDFFLTGLPLNITSSSDSVIGWRYPPLNAFITPADSWWANQDSYFPNSGSYSVQPTESYIQWESDMSMAYSKIVLRCPPNTAYTGSATLNYVDGVTFTEVQTTSVLTDADGQYFEFSITKPSYQLGWNITFSSLDIAIQSISVSGVLTLLEQQSAPSTRAVLVMYPTGTLPKTIVNSSGNTVKATYCYLATVDVNAVYQIDKIEDNRYIINREYTPVADWLTRPFDDNLINLYEQVSDFPALWMAPPSCMKQEYATLTKDQVIVEN